MEIDAEGDSPAAVLTGDAGDIVWQCEIVTTGQSWWRDYTDTDRDAIEGRFQGGGKSTFPLPTLWEGRRYCIDLGTGQQVSDNGLRRRIRRVRNSFLGEVPTQD